VNLTVALNGTRIAPTPWLLYPLSGQTQPSIPIGDPGSSTERASTLDDAERQLIAQALRQAKGNASEAARTLGVTRMALRYRIEKHGLRSADFRVG